MSDLKHAKISWPEVVIVGCAALAALALMDEVFEIRFYFPPASVARHLFFSMSFGIILLLSPFMAWIAYRKGRNRWAARRRIYFLLTLLPFVWLLQFVVKIVWLALIMD